MTKRFYLLMKTHLLSLRIHTQLSNSPLAPQEATTRPAAVSHNDNTRLLGEPDHCLRSASRTIYNPCPNNNIRSIYPNMYDRYRSKKNIICGDLAPTNPVTHAYPTTAVPTRSYYNRESRCCTAIPCMMRTHITSISIY